MSEQLDKEYKTDPRGLLVDPDNGRFVAVMVPINGAVRATCSQCRRPITQAKNGTWVHSDGALMMHDPLPR